MNNKGFTLTEIIAAIVIVSLALFVVARTIGITLSATKEETYKLMKNNITKAAELYLKECNAKTINCDIKWENDKILLEADILKNNGYYKDLKSPIDNKELGKCLIIEAYKKNKIITTNIIDNCY